MQTPYYGSREPYLLRSNVIFFHDWRYVSHGSYGWRDDRGQPVSLFNAGPLPPASWAGKDNPWGIRLRAIPATKSEPFLSPVTPWEGSVGAPTVMREDGRYRLWYEAVPASHMADGTAGQHNCLCYAESDDGMTWHRPEIGVAEFDGNRRNNIVYGGPLATRWGYHGGGIFRNPTAPPTERYKALHLAPVPADLAEKVRSERPQAEMDPLSAGSQPWWLFGATSPDGIHWTPIDAPVCLANSDTANTCDYDELLGKYVAFVRTWVFGRRSIGRTESSDFRHFPLPETIIWPGADVGPSDLWYANAKNTYPGAPDYHFLFPLKWVVAEDRFFTHIAVSPDSVLWSFPPENRVLCPGEFGAWDTGGVAAGKGLVDLPGDRVGVPFVGYRVPHKYPRWPPLGQLAWATWPRDRIVALESPERGEFRTWRVLFAGQTVRANVVTKHAGSVRIEVLNHRGEVVPGRSFDDCDPVTGNFSDRLVTWRGQPQIDRKPDEPVSFRVRIHAAELYSLRFS
jgi:hypothetical protein